MWKHKQPHHFSEPLRQEDKSIFRNDVKLPFFIAVYQTVGDPAVIAHVIIIGPHHHKGDPNLQANSDVGKVPFFVKHWCVVVDVIDGDQKAAPAFQWGSAAITAGHRHLENVWTILCHRMLELSCAVHKLYTALSPVLIHSTSQQSHPHTHTQRVRERDRQTDTQTDTHTHTHTHTGWERERES